MTAVKEWSIYREPLDVRAMLGGYALMLVVAVLYARSCRAGVLKDSELSRLRQRVKDHRLAVERLDEQIATVEHERDEAIRNWTGWFKRAMEAETERDQGRPSTARRIRCRATAGRGAT